MSDVQTAAPQGLPATAPATDSAESFFEYSYPDGKKETFKTKDELAKGFKESYFAKRDYTQKSMENARIRKALEDERNKFKGEQETFVKSKGKYDEWDRLLQTRPDIYSQLERAAQGPITPDALMERARGYTDEASQALQKRVEELEGMMERQKNEKELDSIFSKMTEEFGEDFSKDEVMEILDTLQNGETEPLIRALHQATKGRKNPLQVEQKIVSNLQKKAKAGLVPSGGGAPQAKTKQFSSIKEAHRAALADAGIDGG
jgi:hypothetical protein